MTKNKIVQDLVMPKHTETDVRNLLAVQFNFSPGEKSMPLFMTALTHEGATTPGNRRLAFIGDSVLRLIIAEFYYNKYKGKTGKLTTLKELVEKNDTLAEIASSHDFSILDHMRFGNTYRTQNEKIQENSIQATAFEALIGAMYSDKGFKATQEAVLLKLKSVLELVLQITT